MISASFLSIKDNLKDNIRRLDKTNINYLHLDIMDALFVPNKTWNIKEIDYLLKDTSKPKDIHLMVQDVKKYVDDFCILNPEYITFHLEVGNTFELINYIKAKGIKVGLSIKPETDVQSLYPFLDDIDLVLVMTVEPGYGNQTFIKTMIEKVNILKRLKPNFHYLIEVDGGINADTIKEIDADIYVVGSYITNSTNYDEQVDGLKENTSV